MTAKQELERQESQPAENVERMRDRRVFTPRTDIYEEDDRLFVVADMPGVADDTIDITLEKNVLTIRGESSPAVPEGCSLVYAETEPGDYERTFTLSDEIDRDNIEATVKNGVLRLTLPKAQPERKKIAVKSA